ncbi:hypothetical protein ABPG75_005415 [Micractinium tetrahymenae]
MTGADFSAPYGGAGAGAAPAGRRRPWQAIKTYFAVPPEAESGVPMNGGMNPVLKSYMHPHDFSVKRYAALLIVFAAGIFWWLGPCLSMFILDPLLNLGVASIQVINPRTDCYDHKKVWQECPDTSIGNVYHFYHLANAEQWMAGLEPPRFEEKGPYHFKVNEIRHNISYTQNWTQVSYTYHTYETLDPQRSCDGCTLDDTLTVVNRGYQQFMNAMRDMASAMSAPSLSPAPIPEAQIYYFYVPSILVAIREGLEYGLTMPGGYYQFFGNQSATPADDALKQWASCGYLQPIVTAGFLASPYYPVDPLSNTSFHFAPELCAYTQTTFNASDIGLDLGAAAALWGALTYNSTSTSADPAATAFLFRFMTLSRATLLATLQTEAAPAPALAAALAPITAPQWGMLQGYLQYLSQTYGNETYQIPYIHELTNSQISAVIQAETTRWLTIAAPQPEKLIVYSLLPMSVRIMMDYVIAGFLPSAEGYLKQMNGIPANDTLPANLEALVPATAEQFAYMQWADCSILNTPTNGTYPPAAATVLPVGTSTPGSPKFPYAPELCAFMLDNYASLGQSFPLHPIMFPELGLNVSAAAARAFLKVVMGASTQQVSDDYASKLIPQLMQANRTAALSLMAPNLTASEAADLAPLTDGAWAAMKLWLINLLPTWGKLVYVSWLHANQPGPGVGGLFVTKTVRELLYGYDDPVLKTLAAAKSPYYDWAPWGYRPFIAANFPTADWPIQYFTNVTGHNVSYSMLSHQDTDYGVYHPLVFQKRLVTGAAKGDFPQGILQYNGIPFGLKPHGIMNITGANEGIVQGSNFKPTKKPFQFETLLARPIRTIFTGNNVETKKVKTYQYTLNPESYEPCNATFLEKWKNATGFDETVFRGVVDDLKHVKSTTPAEYWHLMGDDAALTEWLSATELGPLSRYFAQDPTTIAKLARCMNPESFSWAWDLSDAWACPTLYTLPRFYQADADVVATTGNTWEGDFRSHGWYFSVEPFTGMTVLGHKPYQTNMLVSRSDVAYPDLWVAPGSKDTTLGQHYGMDDDFVTVPLSSVMIYWEPTKKSSLALRGINYARAVLYWLFMLGIPVTAGVFLFPSILYLRFSKDSKLRRREMEELHKSRAPRLAMGRHEREMADALALVARNGGSAAGLALPSERSPSDDSEEDGSDDDYDTRFSGVRSSIISIAGGAATLGDAKADVASGKAWEAKTRAAAADEAAGSAPGQPATFSISAAAPGSGLYDLPSAPAQPEEQQADVTVTFMPAAGSARGGGSRDGLRRRTTSAPEQP